MQAVVMRTLATSSLLVRQYKKTEAATAEEAKRSSETCIAVNEYDLEIKNLLSGCQADQLERVERQAEETGGFPPPVVLRRSVFSIRVLDLAAFRSHAADKAPGSTILPLLLAEATEGVLPRPAGLVEEEELELELEEVEDQELEGVEEVD